MYVIPPEQSAEFVSHMEDVLEIYHLPYDPKCPVIGVVRSEYERCNAVLAIKRFQHLNGFDSSCHLTTPKMVRWYTPAQVLKMATSTNAELLALSGPRNLYPGKLGVIEAGALADLLLVNGNPLDNIQLIENPDQNFVVIMKDGMVYKNLSN
jgi:hypothetical protein